MFKKEAQCKNCKVHYKLDAFAFPVLSFTATDYLCTDCGKIQRGDTQRDHDKTLQEQKNEKLRLQLALKNAKLESQKLHEEGKEKERQHMAAEREKERQHEKDMEVLQTESLRINLEQQKEDSRIKENERMRLHDIEKIKADQKKLETEQEFQLKQTEMEQRYKCEVEKQRDQLRYQAEMQDKENEKLRLEIDKARLEIEKLKYRQASIPNVSASGRRQRKVVRKNQQNSNQVNIPVECTGPDDSFKG